MMRWFARAADATALLVLSIFTFRLWRNLHFLRQADEGAQQSPIQTRVSVLVPARNEALSIVRCIESLAQQDYPNYEIIVLDDQSTDVTGRLLDKLAAQYPIVSVIHGDEAPPPEWNGKSFACQRLAARATGEWLLFTDADTEHMARSIAQGVAQAEALGVDLLSAFPRQTTQSWSERIVVSFIVDFLPLISLDLMRLWRGTSESSAANGQYLLVRAAAYRAAGGHEGIAQELVDDFALAKRMRACGYQAALVDGTSMVSCRMYQGAGEVWAGFSKNLLLALSTSSARRRTAWWGAVFAWSYACIFVLPFARLLLRGRRMPLIEIGWLGALRFIVVRRLQRPADEILTTPLAAWSVMAIGLHALTRRWRGASVRWKGRDYPLTD